MLSWSEKIAFMTKKGMSWKEVQEMDKGLEEEKNDLPEDKPEEKPEDKPEEKPEDKPEDNEPTENEKKLLEKIESLETQLKEAQAENVHGNNETLNTSVSFDEQLNEMFKDIRI